MNPEVRGTNKPKYNIPKAFVGIKPLLDPPHERCFEDGDGRGDRMERVVREGFTCRGCNQVLFGHNMECTPESYQAFLKWADQYFGPTIHSYRLGEQPEAERIYDPRGRGEVNE